MGGPAAAALLFWRSGIIIIEGIRRSGKTYTVNLLQKTFPHLIFYKDIGMRIIAGSNVDPDDYAIGRDFAYAQSLPTLCDQMLLEQTVFDRGYWSSYVYGKAWREKHDTTFWRAHITLVEDTYAEWVRNIRVVLITPIEDDITRIENMDRSKDMWEIQQDYKLQWALYQEVAKMTKAKVIPLKAFQSDEYITDIFRTILLS